MFERVKSRVAAPFRWARSHRRATVAASAVLVGAGIGALLAVSSRDEPAAQPRAAPPERAVVYFGGGPVEPRPEKKPKERPERNVPAVRLPRDHDPASGPGVARVKIPSIDVSAPMIKLGLNSDETLQVPGRASDTGWWSGGAFPGKRGPAVIAGHVDSRTGPAVFHRLGELSPGDEVVVIPDNGPRARFAVGHAERHPKNDFPTRSVYSETSEPTLRLITCTGSFDAARGHYRDNLIVFARRA